MHQDQIGQRQLAKARAHPLNAHCRKLLQQAGQEVLPTTVGGPELMEWALEQSEGLGEEERMQIAPIVEIILDKPTMANRLLLGEEPGKGEDPWIQSFLQEKDPLQAGLSLIRYLQKRSQSYYSE